MSEETTDNLICAIIGTCALFFALIFIRYAGGCNTTQDEKRHNSNKNKN